jgi:hypothetical protein
LTLFTALALGAALVGGATTVTAKPGDKCGGVAGIACGAHESCRIAPPIYPDKMGACVREAARPQMCNMLYQPVCGRNGKTYPNRCHAQRAGVKVRHAGQCFTPVPPTPLEAVPPTPLRDPPVRSEPKPPASGSQVMCPMIYQPVCGADGKTYPNSCHATRAGASIAHTGACEAPK